MNATSTDEDSGRRPLLTVSVTAKQPPGVVPPQTYHGYGTTSIVGSSSARSSPERYRRDSLLGRVPEESAPVDEGPEEAEEDGFDLEERGLYIGSYKRTVALYTLVPVTSLLAFILLAVLPSVLWHSEHRGPPIHSRFFSSPLPELTISAALWSLSYLLRFPLYTVCSLVLPTPLGNTILFNAVYVILSQLLRLSALPILHIRHEMQYPLPTWQDPVFERIWWISLGWALADVAVGIAQGYEQLALYKDVMIPEERVRDLLVTHDDNWGSGSRRSRTSADEALPLSPRPGLEEQNGLHVRTKPRGIEDAIKVAVDKDLEQLVSLKEREELEEIYGIPPIKIPVFVSCLQRIDAFLLSLGFTLIVAASYLRSRISFPDASSNLPSIYTNRTFVITFPLVVLVHLFLSLLHAPPVLRRIGVHTTAYVGFLVGLGSVFTGLALWDALS